MREGPELLSCADERWSGWHTTLLHCPITVAFNRTGIRNKHVRRGREEQSNNRKLYTQGAVREREKKMSCSTHSIGIRQRSPVEVLIWQPHTTHRSNQRRPNIFPAKRRKTKEAPLPRYPHPVRAPPPLHHPPSTLHSS